MWAINDDFWLMAIIYVALGLAVGVLISIRRSRRKNSTQDQKKSQTATALSHSTYVVNGRYDLSSPPFKQGGMATIWLAVERKTGKTRIIKTARRGTSIDNVYLDKLMLEASCLKGLNHPGIVKYCDDFYFKDEFHLVIEYITGETLLTSSVRSPFTEQQVIGWACQLLDTLAYLHDHGMVHRDINPKNIMLCNDGAVKLIDFGTAKKLNNGGNKDKTMHDPFTQITNRGFDIPELFIGGDSDQRCDLCGLAQTCIYLLTLDQPNEVCSKLLKSNWPRSYHESKTIADYLIAEGLSSRTAKCLAQGIRFSADDRFADAHAMKAALSSVEGYSPKPVEVLAQK